LESQERLKQLKRYLLFDAGCTFCTTLAQSIEQESQGWLQARSLREPEMQAYLEQANHQLRWEPTLVEVTNTRVHVSTGWTLRRKLLLGLGPRRMWHVLSLVDGQHQNVSQPERRQFFRLGGALLGGFALGLGWRGALPVFAAGSRQEPLDVQTPLLASQARQFFEHHPLLQQAQVHFGASDWSGTIRFTHRQTQQISYGLPLSSESGVPSLLLLAETESQASASRKGLVLQVYADGNGRSTFHLFLPDGASQGSFTLDQGKLVPSQPDGSGGGTGKLICVAACVAAADTLGKGGAWVIVKHALWALDPPGWRVARGV
jgi:predicted DCC family thiol-disulfide oxidoreductase YuxK